jgi:two-component system sensor histidine kinase TctE
VQASFAQQIDLGFEQGDDAVGIAANPLMLRELLSNLIDNALRYTPAGGSVTVRVRVDANHPILEVDDTGPGIALGERARVFERFYRILGSGTAGSGLGLAIVREIAHQHGAEVAVFNNPRSSSGSNGVGKKPPGSLFRVTFPTLDKTDDNAD